MEYSNTQTDSEILRSNEVLAALGEGNSLPEKPRYNYWLHIGLFILTFASTTYAGVTFLVPPNSIHSPGDLFANWRAGLPFSTLLMLFLSAHEFGHFIAARRHNVDATLPFYIPMPLFMFGTLGAVIQTRSVVPSRKAMFDIGVAGPIAGFVVALAYLVIGMLTAGDINWLYHIHPEYRALSVIPSYGMHFGGFLLFDFLKWVLVPAGRFFLPMNEIYHNPFLAIGWFGMFVTALNMIPVGQLDGGHVVYSMFGGKIQRKISRAFVIFLLAIGTFGFAGPELLEASRNYLTDKLAIFLQHLFGPPLEWMNTHAWLVLHGWTGWIFWAGILIFFIRIPHPPVPDETPLDKRRMIIGWISLAILVLTFSITGIYEIEQPPHTAASAVVMR